jgi:two-component system, cell cycle sensor histidine kinase and response regulator CckA
MVDDEEDLLQLGVDALEELGYTVLSASTPADALHLAQKHAGSISLLISDVIMPEMNGKELARQILLLQPGLKCLFMSGYTAAIITNGGVLDEDMFFIQKPFLLKDLADKVRQTLKK